MLRINLMSAALFSFCLIFVGCSKQEASKNALDASKKTVVELMLAQNNSVIVGTYNTSTDAASLDDGFFKPNVEIGEENHTLEEAYILGSVDDGKAYAVAKYTSDVTGSAKIIAWPVEADGAPATVTETHTCTGDPCSHCDFTFLGGVIKGCECNTAGSGNSCNHSTTLTTTTDVDFW